MGSRTIPVIDQRQLGPTWELTQPLVAPKGELRDLRSRPLRDLRISVTDRCNFRCNYCMPKEVFDSSYTYLPQSALLSFEEITRVARQFVAHGVQKIRLTGGEPLLRKHIEVLIAQLSQLRTPEGQALDLTLTTNGSLLARKAQALKDAGLKRITISLDGLSDTVFRQMNDVDFPVSDVLDGIQTAVQAGLGVDASGRPSGIKINMVVKRHTNLGEVLPMARHFLGSGMALRFIEYMDVGETNGWAMDEVVPSRELLHLLQTEFRLVPLSFLERPLLGVVLFLGAAVLAPLRLRIPLGVIFGMSARDTKLMPRHDKACIAGKCAAPVLLCASLLIYIY
jgi:cyclic pyranopterin phosphate synthase